MPLCSVRQLRMFLDEYPDIPYDTLRYTCGECNYGGRVTDSHDRHTLMTLLSCYYKPELVGKEQCTLSGSGMYFVPAVGDHKVSDTWCLQREDVQVHMQSQCCVR